MTTRPTFYLLFGSLLLATAYSQQGQAPELLSELMQKVSATPAFREKVLDATRSVPKIGEWLSPELVKDLRTAILGKDWQRVDHFPALTVGALNRSVEVTMKVAGPSKKKLAASDLIDLGAYRFEANAFVDLNQAATRPDPRTRMTHPPLLRIPRTASRWGMGRIPRLRRCMQKASALQKYSIACL